jgi:hypothetical protein
MPKEKSKKVSVEEANCVWEIYSRNYWGKWITSRRTHDEAVEIANALYWVWHNKNRQKVSNGKKVKPFHAEIVKRNVKTGESFLVPYFAPVQTRKTFIREEEDPDWNPEWEKWI